MRTATLIILSLLLTVSTTTACDKGGDKGGDKRGKKADDVAPAEGGAVPDGGGAAADGGGAPAGGTAELALPKVGLRADAPAGTTVMDMGDSDMVQSPHLVATVEKGDDKPKTGDDAIEDADVYTPKDPKVETLADGYVLTFTNSGDFGTNYFVNARREIEGAAYWCTTTSSTQVQSDNAVAFCKSLRK